MKAINIHFFSTTDNSQAKPKTGKAAKPAKVVLTGYISSSGKLVFPAKTVANLGINLDNTFSVQLNSTILIKSALRIAFLTLLGLIGAHAVSCLSASA
ncbi:hypothetical protein [Spirosoma migulaei]